MPTDPQREVTGGGAAACSVQRRHGEATRSARGSSHRSGASQREPEETMRERRHSVARDRKSRDFSLTSGDVDSFPVETAWIGQKNPGQRASKCAGELPGALLPVDCLPGKGRGSYAHNNHLIPEEAYLRDVC